MRLTLAFVLALAACSDKGDDTGLTSAECTATVVSTFPAAGEEHFYRDPFGFVLSAPDAGASITTDVPGSLSVSEDGLTLSWVPSSPLSPSTSYLATLNSCGGTTELAFSTSVLGTPLADPTSILGNVYELDLPNANVVQPEGIGPVLSTLLEVVLTEVVAVTASEVDVLGAVAVPNSNPATEDYCVPTIDFPAADFAEQPFFHLGPADVDLVVSGAIVTVGDLELTGAFASDGSYLGNGVLTGLVDTRPLALVENPEGDGSDICELVGSFNVECQPCPSDGAAFCLDLRAEDIVAQLRADIDLVEVTGYNCEGCESGPPADGAVCEG